MSLVAKSVPRRRTCLRSLRTALNTAAILGAIPYSCRGQLFVFETWRLLYHIFSAFILPFLGAYALAFPKPVFGTSLFPIIVFSIQYVPYMFSIFTFLICNILHRSDFESAARQLLKIERMLFLLNGEPNINYKFWRGVLYGFLIVSCSAGHLIIDGSTNLSLLAFFLTLHYGNLLFFASENLMLFFLESIHHCLDMLVRRASSREIVLVQLCTIHDRLADVIASIQKIYGLPVLFMAFSAFLFINCNIFVAYKVLHRPVMPIIFCWIFIVSSLIFRISYTCRKIKEKGNQFYRILYNFVKRDKSGRLLNNAYLSAHLLKIKSFSFNVAGFGEVDLKFAAGMILATTTYAVIIIQMGNKN